MGSGASLAGQPGVDLTLVTSLDDEMAKYGQERVNQEWLLTAESAETKEEMTDQLKELRRLSRTLNSKAKEHVKTRYWIHRQIAAMEHRIKSTASRKSAFAESLKITAIREIDEEELAEAQVDFDDSASIESSFSDCGSVNSATSDSSDGSWVYRRNQRELRDRRLQQLHRDLCNHQEIRSKGKKLLGPRAMREFESKRNISEKRRKKLKKKKNARVAGGSLVRWKGEGIPASVEGKMGDKSYALSAIVEGKVADDVGGGRISISSSFREEKESFLDDESKFNFSNDKSVSVLDLEDTDDVDNFSQDGDDEDNFNWMNNDLNQRSSEYNRRNKRDLEKERAKEQARENAYNQALSQSHSFEFSRDSSIKTKRKFKR
eukprot:g2422.t1